MTWYAENSGDVASGAVLALTALGVVVTFAPKFTRPTAAKIGFTMLLVAIGTVAWHSNKIAREAFETRITGGNNFAYLRVRPETDQRGWNLVAITTTGALPSLHVGFYPLSPAGDLLREKQKWVQFGALPPTTSHPGIALAPGRYQIHFLMGAKKWVEHLEFKRSGKAVTQVFRVERDGEVIYREPIRDQ